MNLGPTEQSIFFILHGYNLPGLNHVMMFFSGATPWIPLACFLIWKISKLKSRRDTLVIFTLCLMLLALVDTSTSYFFKNLIRRLRPCKMIELKSQIAQFGQACGGKWGFFSSHAANSVALVSFLIPFASLNRMQTFLAVLVVIIVCYSRIYLGVHLPLDIVVGCLWGGILSSCWVWIAKQSITGPSAA